MVDNRVKLLFKVAGWAVTALTILPIFLQIRSPYNCPLYSASPPEQVSCGDSGGFYYRKILLLNNGNTGLGHSDFINNNPMEICLGINQELQDAFLIGRSRDELGAELRFDRGKLMNPARIVVDFDKKEVLERGDGVLIGVYYCGQKGEDWAIKSRIKGNLEGFRVVEWGKFISWTSRRGVMLAFYLGMFVVAGLWNLTDVLEPAPRKWSEMKVWGKIFIVCLACIFLITIYQGGRLAWELWSFPSREGWFAGAY